MRHTPLPWKVSNYRPNNIIARDPKESTYNHGDDKFIPLAHAQTLDDGRFIVHACNNHYQLVEALELAWANMSGGKKSCGHDYDCVCVGDKIKAALKAARGEE